MMSIVSKLNDKAVTKTIEAIFQHLLTADIEMQRVVLNDLIDNVLDPLSEDDFFGTEGWNVWCGLD